MTDKGQWLAAAALVALLGGASLGCEGVLGIPDVSLATGDATTESSSGNQGGGGKGGAGTGGGENGGGGAGAQGGGGAFVLSFKPFESYPTGIEKNLKAEDVAVIDCNSDGAAYLVVADRDPSAGAVVLMMNDGSGVFKIETTMQAPALEPSQLAVAQLDGEHGLDIAVGLGGTSENNSGFVIINATDTSCVFSSPSIVAKNTRRIADLVAVDIDSYGEMDLVGAVEKTGEDELAIWNSFSKELKVMDLPDARPVAIVAGLINGDDKPDVAYLASMKKRKVFIHYNSGSALEPTAIQLPESGELTNPSDLALGDVDGDGDNDLLVLLKDPSSIEGFINDEGTGFTQKTYQLGGAAGSSALVMTDMDGDKKADFVVANYDYGTVSVFLLKNGEPTPAPGSPYAVQASPTNLDVGDLNKDGRPDIVTCHDSGDVSVLLSGT